MVERPVGISKGFWRGWGRGVFFLEIGVGIGIGVGFGVAIAIAIEVAIGIGIGIGIAIGIEIGIGVGVAFGIDPFTPTVRCSHDQPHEHPHTRLEA